MQRPVAARIPFVVAHWLLAHASCGGEPMSRIGLLVTAAGLLSSLALAENCDRWVLRSQTGPPPRYAHAMAYDAFHAVTVIFGGRSATHSPLNDTWEWNGSDWTERASVGPAARFEHAMAYDAARGVSVLFGGRDGTSIFGDTWEWDGASWVLRATTGPTPRSLHAMAFDSQRGVVVLFGGLLQGDIKDGETWEWDGNSWSLRAVTGPPPRHRHAMAFDEALGVTVMHGGSPDTVPFYSSDSWEWNGAGWIESTVPKPTSAAYHGFAYDAVRMRLLRYGGPTAGTQSTWKRVGQIWSALPGFGPGGRWYIQLAFDKSRSTTVLFGGIASWNGPVLGDTWEFVHSDQPPDVIDLQPRTALIFGGTEWTVRAAGTPIAFQWRRNGVDLVNGPTGWGSWVSGAQSAELKISYLQYQDESEYSVLVTNRCGATESNAVFLDVVPCSPLGDCTGDGKTGQADLALLHSCYNRAPCCDLDGNGTTDRANLAMLLSVYRSGCD